MKDIMMRCVCGAVLKTDDDNNIICENCAKTYSNIDEVMLIPINARKIEISKQKIVDSVAKDFEREIQRILR